MMEKLKLTAAQKEKMADLRETQQRKMIGVRSGLAEAQLDLRKLMRADAPSQAQIDATIDRMSRLRGDAQKSRIATHIAMRGLLTDSQKKTLDEMKGEMRGMGGGMGGGMGDGGGRAAVSAECRPADCQRQSVRNPRSAAASSAAVGARSASERGPSPQAAEIPLGDARSRGLDSPPSPLHAQYSCPPRTPHESVGPRPTPAGRPPGREDHEGAGPCPGPSTMTA